MYVEQIMTMLGLSDLQFALAAIGLLILISVAVLNLKYSRARRKTREESVLANDSRVRLRVISTSKTWECTKQQIVSD